MKSLYSDFSTPTMAMCEMIGRELGLVKRVVQVFFQNARAKEKKGKLPLQKTSSTNESLDHQPYCKLCGFNYSSNVPVQEHIFTKAHIDMIKASIRAGTFPGNHKEHYLDATTPNGGQLVGDSSFNISVTNEPEEKFLHLYGLSTTNNGSNTINFPNLRDLPTSSGK